MYDGIRDIFLVVLGAIIASLTSLIITRYQISANNQLFYNTELLALSDRYITNVNARMNIPEIVKDDEVNKDAIIRTIMERGAAISLAYSIIGHVNRIKDLDYIKATLKYTMKLMKKDFTDSSAVWTQKYINKEYIFDTDDFYKAYNLIVGKDDADIEILAPY